MRRSVRNPRRTHSQSPPRSRRESPSEESTLEEGAEQQSYAYGAPTSRLPGELPEWPAESIGESGTKVQLPEGIQACWSQRPNKDGQLKGALVFSKEDRDPMANAQKARCLRHCSLEGSYRQRMVFELVQYHTHRENIVGKVSSCGGMGCLRRDCTQCQSRLKRGEVRELIESAVQLEENSFLMEVLLSEDEKEKASAANYERCQGCVEGAKRNLSEHITSGDTRRMDSTIPDRFDEEMKLALALRESMMLASTPI